MSSPYRCTVTSEFENLATIARFVAEAADRLGLDAKTAYALQLAVDEACTNVIAYAYGGQKGQPVTVECTRDKDTCVVTIRDRGQPFDPSRVPLPDVHAPLCERKEGGLGIYLIRTLMDDVRFRFDAQHGNELTLVKRISPRESEPAVSSREHPRQRPKQSAAAVG